MLPGFNHNVRFNNRLYHVQTEDNGLRMASVVTQVFLAGQVLALEKTSYQDLLEGGRLEGKGSDEIRFRMQEQHKMLLKRVAEGAFEAQVDAILGPGAPSPVSAIVPTTPPFAPRLEQATTDPLPTFAEIGPSPADATARIGDNDFLSSLDAAVRRHIETTDPSLPPFDSTVLPAEPPPILPRSHAHPPSHVGSQAGRLSRAASSLDNPSLNPSLNDPPRARRVRPRGPRDTLVDQPSPLAPEERVISDRPGRPVRFRRPASSNAVKPIEQDELRRASAELGLPMPDEPGHGDPNSTLLELDAIALKTKLDEQRAKLRRASEVANEQRANRSARPKSGTGQPIQPAAESRVTVNERSLDEVLLSYLDEEKK